MVLEFYTRRPEDAHFSINSENPLSEDIEALKNKSSFERTETETGTLLTSKTGEVFELQKKYPEDKQGQQLLASEVRDFLVSNFPPDEVEEPAYLEYVLKRNPQMYQIVRDSEGRIAGLLSSELMREDESDKNASMFVWYVLNDKKQKNKGLGRELYIGAYENAQKEAQSEGLELKSVIGETVPEVEGYLNKMGRKRLFYRDQEDNLCEVPYLQPPVAEGEPAPEAGETQLMLKMIDGRQSVGSRELLQILKPIYTQQYSGIGFAIEVEGVSRDSAQRWASRVVMPYLDQLSRHLQEAKDGQIQLLDADRLEELKLQVASEGKKFFNIEQNIKKQERGVS
jgi:hypothetical protein